MPSGRPCADSRSRASCHRDDDVRTTSPQGARSATTEHARSNGHRHGRPFTPMEGYHVLTLTRSVGETIRIGDDIEVHVVEVRGGTVRLGFKAPREVAIHREEVYRQIAEANLLAAQVTADSLGALAAFAPSPQTAVGVAADGSDSGTTSAEEDAADTDDPSEDAPA